MAFMFENLEVYQKAVDFAAEVAGLAEGFPRGYGFLVDQLNRAALSIATNLAEGNGRFTTPFHRHFFGIARNSIQECIPLLELAARRRNINSKQDDRSRSRLEEPVRTPSGLVNALDQRKVRLCG